MKLSDSAFLRICDTLSENVSCLSRHIGCVIVKDNKIISTGYNGPPKGYPHCIDFCAKHTAEGVKPDNCMAVHAEQNAIINARGVDLQGATLYLNSVVPCFRCAGLIINAGITTVVHGQEGVYDMSAMDLFKQCGVSVRYCEDYKENKLNVY